MEKQTLKVHELKCGMYIFSHGSWFLVTAMFDMFPNYRKVYFTHAQMGGSYNMQYEVNEELLTMLPVEDDASVQLKKK